MKPGKLALLIGTLLIAGCQSGATPPLCLGQVGNLSGVDRAGKQAEQGIRLALKRLSDDQLAEALDGRALQVRHADTRGQLDAYEGEAVRLTTVNRVIGLIGGTTADEVARLDRAHVPVLALGGVRPPGGSDNVFAIGIRPVQQAFILAKHAAEDLNLFDVTVIVDERREDFLMRADAFGRRFVEERRAQGKTAATPAPVRFGKDADWAKLAKQIATAGTPRAILFAGTGRDCAELQRHLPLTPVLLFAGDDGDTADLHGSAILATAFAPDAGLARQQDFIRLYRDGFHAEPDVAAALGYEVMVLYAEGLKQISPGFNPEKLQAALRELKDVPGLSGSLTMTPELYLRRSLFLARLDRGVVTLVKRYEPAALP